MPNTELTERKAHPIDGHGEEPAPVQQGSQRMIFQRGIGMNPSLTTKYKPVKWKINHPSKLGDALFEGQRESTKDGKQLFLEYRKDVAQRSEQPTDLAVIGIDGKAKI